MFARISLKCQYFGCTSVLIVQRHFIRYSSKRLAGVDPRNESNWPLLWQEERKKRKPLVLQDMPKYYEPSAVQSTQFNYDDIENNDACSPFSMILPPPNVTGTLHLGHALTIVIQDTIFRWMKMNGYHAVWIPGCDHAGIATQVRVEQMLKKEKNLNRHQMNVEEFKDHILDWKLKKEKEIFEQVNSFGASLDYTKSIFTLDSKMTDAVVEAFVRLHDAGLIYRCNSLVNWSCHLRSAISDLEVDHKVITEPTKFSVPGYVEPIEFGVIYNFAYPMENGKDEIVVSTTRPETMLGDTAVAVHPGDTRYNHLHGCYCTHPFTKQTIPVLCDDAVDKHFGMGAVKITPGHDSNDFELASRHGLNDVKNILNEDGTLCEDLGTFSGLPRFTARRKIITELSNIGLFRGSMPHEMNVPICSRSGDVVEKLMRWQWHVKCDSMARMAVKSVENGELQLLPKRHEAVWYEWLKKSSKDWCISRQLVWGNQIPAYKVSRSSGGDDVDAEDVWVSAKDENEALDKASRLTNIPKCRLKLQRDTDVLDTWFSSALIPAVVMGWPHNIDSYEYQKLYPLSLMETGLDILFFWVARMVMLGQQLTGMLPFKKVLLHGLIVDANEKKMSKSLGNVLNPEDVSQGASLVKLLSRVDESVRLGYMSDDQAALSKKSLKAEYPNGIPECGNDGMRFFLLQHDIQREKIKINTQGISNGRQLCNKVWQACRFMSEAYKNNGVPVKDIDCIDLDKIDRWILSRTADLVSKSQSYYENYEFHLVCSCIQKFWFSELCNTYVECIKLAVYGDNKSDATRVINVLLKCFETGLLCSYPIMPAVSENLYRRIPRDHISPQETSICSARYPTLDNWQKWRSESVESEMNAILKIVSLVRRLKKDFPSVRGSKHAILHCAGENSKERCSTYKAEIGVLGRIQEIEITDEKIDTKDAIISIVGDVTVALTMDKKFDKEIEMKKLDDRLKKINKEIKKLELLIENPGFQSKAPLNIRQLKSDKFKELKADHELLTNILHQMN